MRTTSFIMSLVLVLASVLGVQSANMKSRMEEAASKKAEKNTNRGR
jgi:hypothetical protein